MISFIDTHAHLDAEQFDLDRDTLIRNLPVLGIDLVVTIGDDLASAARAMHLAETYEHVFCTVGFHPHHALKFNQEVREKIKGWLSAPKVKALGEIGLDYHYELSPRELQKNAFGELLQLSQEMEKPVVIHNRKSDDDLLSIIKESGLNQSGKGFNGVIHCFDSSLAMAKSCLDLGLFISFSGMITFKKADELREVVKYVPLDRILIETDSPFLAPIPKRGQRNEPSFVRYVAEKVAEIKSLPLEMVASITTGNAQRFYGLSCLMLFLIANF